MRFSTKSRYGLRLMAELACAAPGRATPLKEISAPGMLTRRDLAQGAPPLAGAGRSKSERGGPGGYRLGKAPAHPTAGEIIAAMEGSVAPIPCLESEINECPLSGQCATLPFWAGLDEVINQYLDSVTLADIAQSMAESQGGPCSQAAKLPKHPSKSAGCKAQEPGAPGCAEDVRPAGVD